MGMKLISVWFILETGNLRLRWEGSLLKLGACTIKSYAKSRESLKPVNPIKLQQFSGRWIHMECHIPKISWEFEKS